MAERGKPIPLAKLFGFARKVDETAQDSPPPRGQSTNRFQPQQPTAPEAHSSSDESKRISSRLPSAASSHSQPQDSDVVGSADSKDNETKREFEETGAATTETQTDSTKASPAARRFSFEEAPATDPAEKSDDVQARTSPPEVPLAVPVLTPREQESAAEPAVQLLEDHSTQQFLLKGPEVTAPTEKAETMESSIEQKAVEAVGGISDDAAGDDGRKSLSEEASSAEGVHRDLPSPGDVPATETTMSTHLTKRVTEEPQTHDQEEPKAQPQPAPQPTPDAISHQGETGPQSKKKKKNKKNKHKSTRSTEATTQPQSVQQQHPTPLTEASNASAATASADAASHTLDTKGPSLKLLLEEDLIPDPQQYGHVPTPSEGLHSR